MQWGRLPAELRARAQWCIAGADKAPYTADAEGRLWHASVTRPEQWLTFDRATAVATAHGLLVGYVLSAEDPFTCIDLDVKDEVSHPDEPHKWTSAEQFDLYYRIIQSLDSFTERSRSGKGFHVWVQGKIGKGYRRDGIELYSQERFIICTGDVVLERSVADRQQLLWNMTHDMHSAAVHVLEEVEQVEDDWYVLATANEASNADKFSALWRGEWQELGFPSQSEADMALMSMLTFYSPSNEQCRRLFRDSGLGKREKAQKDDRYLNLTLSAIRAREAREREHQKNFAARAAEQVQRLQGGPARPRAVQPLQAPQVQPVYLPAPVAASAALAAPQSASVVTAGDEGLRWPPGIVGRIAQFIFQSAPRPIKEVAIVAALGLMAGIAGKAWHIPQSGLNLYIVLIAQSGVGKEAMHSGISLIIRNCSAMMPTFSRFFSFSDMASGPALVKACAVQPSLLNIVSEWGRKLKAISREQGRVGPMTSFRTTMTGLYQKSGPQAIVGGITYSNKDSNIDSIAGVSYSMIGESTPGTFYECLTEDMMEDGFMSRFLLVEYQGQRPPMNLNQVVQMDEALRDTVVRLAFRATELMTQNQSQPLSRTDEAAAIMAQFELECDANINANRDEGKRQMYNRAALKAMRIAALLAVGDNSITPCITKDHIEWAIAIVKRDIAIMDRRIEAGDVGVSDFNLDLKVLGLIHEFFRRESPDGYQVHPTMKQSGIIPRVYLQRRTASISQFRSHRMGQRSALDRTLESLVQDGYIEEVSRAEALTAFGFSGKCYRLINIA